MSDELPPMPQPEQAEAPVQTSRRSGPGSAILVILLATLPLIGIMYLGHQLLNLPFIPFDLYDWPIRAGIAPWISLIDTLTGSQVAVGGNIAQSASLVQWLLSLWASRSVPLSRDAIAIPISSTASLSAFSSLCR